MLYGEALNIANRVRHALLPGCERLVIAGSLRREKPEVKDIEIVGELRMGGLFGDVPDTGALEAAIAQAINPGVMEWDTELRRNGEKYKRFKAWPDGVSTASIAVDFFIADHDNFGNILAIRTGNSDFSRLLVTKCSQGGLMPDAMRQDGGHLFKDGVRLSCSTESAFFEALDIPVVAPKDRSAESVARIRKEKGF